MNFIRSTYSPVAQMLAATAIFALVLSLGYGAIPVAYATETNPNTDITICHATGSNANPYVSPNPDDGAKTVQGHDGHNGPVWFSGITVTWGDIIPPFTYFEKEGNGQNVVWVEKQYLGKNWTTEGQAIWNNDCKPVPPPVPGCTDKDATNYSKDATTDNGSCLFPLTVTKVIVGTTDKTPINFSFQIDGGSATAFEADGTNVIAKANGTYDITEVSAPGFTTTYQGCDNLNIAGAGATCTITNTVTYCAKGYTGIYPDCVPENTPTGTLKVWKNVVGATVTDYSTFSFTVDGVPYAFPANQNYLFINNIPITSSPTVIEDAEAGYVATYAEAGYNDIQTPTGDCTDIVITANQQSNCRITNTLIPEDKVATFVAEKIVCTIESDLPNWGNGTPVDITSTTAADWVATHKSCSLVSGWDFEWVLDSETSDAGDTLVGPADGNWTTFGPTNGSGKTSVSLSATDLNTESRVWFREVLKSNYIPFTHEATPNNSNNVTAELYCHTDGLNYDNYEWVDGIELGKTYHCVAWNVPTKVTEVPVCEVGENLLSNGSFEAEVVTNATLWQKFLSVTGWGVAKVSDGTPTTLELHRSWSGNVAQNGAQYAELDGDESVRVKQSVLTESGAEYKLSWAFAPRQDTGAAQNMLSVEVEGTEVATNGPTAGIGVLDATSDWTLGTHSFTASDASTDIAFKDAGSSDSFGTFLDNAVLCKTKNAPRVSDVMLCKVDAKNVPLSGWTLTLDKTTLETSLVSTVDYSGITGTDGCATFEDVPFGTYQADEILQQGWEKVSGTGSVEIDSLTEKFTIVNKPKDSEPNYCTITLVSGTDVLDDKIDDNTTVVQKGGALAKLLSTVNGAWTTIGGAKWIWGDNPVVTPIVGATQTFERTFGWNGPVTSAKLTIASDNSYTTMINGDASGADASINNFSVADEIDVTAFIEQGNNILSMNVLNTAGAENAQDNPAGLIYKLEVKGTNSLCNPPYEEETYMVDGFKWNDLNGNGLWETIGVGAEPTLAGWMISVTNGVDTFSTTTDATGRYWFEVPEGDWIVSEVQQPGWTQTYPNPQSEAEGMCYVSFGEYEYRSTTQSEDDSSDDTIGGDVSSECNFGNKRNGGDENPKLACSLTASDTSIEEDEDVTLFWNTTLATSATINGNPVALDGSQLFENLQSDTVYTLVATQAMEGEDNVVECSVSIEVDEDNGGGGSSGSKKKRSTSDSEPIGEVLGESTSVLPVGAPNTGAGGSAPSPVASLIAIFGMLMSLVAFRITKNAQ